MQSYKNTAEEAAARRAEDEKWMRRCLQLARCGHLGAPPNPMVGAVIVYDGRILGEGFHARCGKGHAEVHAIGSVRPADRPLLSAATLYVSLEPCAHYGRTPPCAELIVRTGLRRVVVGCIDPFARVSGRGIDILRRGGIDVTIGVLEDECRDLIRRFVTCQSLGRPYITLKWAASADGFLDAWRTVDDGQAPAALSTSASMIRMHRLRADHQAIVVGHDTLRLDHPSLTVRHWADTSPRRVVLGAVDESELPAGFTAFADIDTLLTTLRDEGVQALMVEGGGRTLQAFIDRGLWDEAHEELSTVVLGSGVPTPRMPLGVVHTTDTHWGVSYHHWRKGHDADTADA
jgi:diaminohydroxyphosphoribosylaminopyrimidine deaminase/5-amino-6-(5-phosphoribosylamino)uracil reductase